MTTYDNTNRGVLFKNNDKNEDRDPDYRGQINFNGVECWLDAWVNTAKKDGKKFMALRVKPKQAQDHKGGSANPPSRTSAPKDDGLDSEIPF